MQWCENDVVGYLKSAKESLDLLEIQFYISLRSLIHLVEYIVTP